MSSLLRSRWGHLFSIESHDFDCKKRIPDRASLNLGGESHVIFSIVRGFPPLFASFFQKGDWGSELLRGEKYQN